MREQFFTDGLLKSIIKDRIVRRIRKKLRQSVSVTSIAVVFWRRWSPNPILKEEEEESQSIFDWKAKIKRTSQASDTVQH